MIKIDDAEYLGFIFKIIERLSSFSFQIKAWELSLLGVLTALLINKLKIEFVFMILLIILLFFMLLDMFYFTLEKKYRNFYEDIVNNGHTNYSLKLPSGIKFSDFLSSLVNRSILFFYCPQIIAFIVITIISLA